MTTKSLVHLPVFRDSFMFFQGRRAFIEYRQPVELDAAHRRFFAMTLVGGIPIETIVEEMPNTILVEDTRPTVDEVLARLCDPESFVEACPWDGARRFDGIVVDLEGEDGCLSDAVALATELAAKGREVLLVTGFPIEERPPGLRLLAFEESATSPYGTPYRFLQFVRAVLAYVEPTTVLLADFHQAIFLLGAIERHRLGVCLRAGLAPFLTAGPALVRRSRPDRAILYSELLYWLHRKKPTVPFLDVLKQTSSAVLAGWLLLPDINWIFVRPADRIFVRRLDARPPRRLPRVAKLSPSAVSAFLEGADPRPLPPQEFVTPTS